MTFPAIFSRFAMLAFSLAILLTAATISPAQAKPPDAAPDVLVLSNGDTLHGKFVSETAGKVTFHSDPLGDISLGWDKIKELHATGKFGVINQSIAIRGKRRTVQFPVGTIDVTDQAVVVHPDNAPSIAPIPVKNAQFIMDNATLDKQINREPGFFTGWNGAATAGATLVSATDNQYTVTGAVNLVRAIPTVSWLDARNKTLLGFNESFGQITQPAYSYSPGPSLPLIEVPSVVSKSSLSFSDTNSQHQNIIPCQISNRHWSPVYSLLTVPWVP